MPRRPLPFREIIRRLEAAGFVEVGQKGSHVKFARTVGGETRTAIVPHHREVSIGTLILFHDSDVVIPGGAMVCTGGSRTALLRRQGAVGEARMIREGDSRIARTKYEAIPIETSRQIYRERVLQAFSAKPE